MHPCPEYFRGVSPYEGYSPPPFRQSPLPGAPMMAPSPIPPGLGYMGPGGLAPGPERGYVAVPLEPGASTVGCRYEPEDHDGPTTADIIANQSQDYVDEKLAEYQATIQQLQGVLFFLLVLGLALADVSQDCKMGRIPADECCKNPNSEYAMLADPTDCKSYCVCRKGKPIWLVCEGGHFPEVFDVEQRICVATNTPYNCPQKP